MLLNGTDIQKKEQRTRSNACLLLSRVEDRSSVFQEVDVDVG